MQEKLWTSEFFSMSGTNFFFFMSQYIMVSALPIFIMESLGGGELEAGLAMTSFQCGAVLCRPLAGKCIDAVNKRRLLFTATVAFLLIMTGFSVFQTFTGLYVLRFAHGIVFAIGTTCAATLVALLLPAQKKGTGIGYFALSTNLAMVVGPFIGLILAQQFGSDVLFFFMIGLALFTVILANVCHMPDDVILPSKRKKKGFHLADFIAREAIWPSAISGLVFFAYGGIITFISLYMHQFELQAETSIFFVVFAAAIVLTRPVIGWIFDRKGADYTVYPGFLIYFLGMFLFSRITTLTELFIASVFLGIGFGALSPAFQTLAVRSVCPEKSGVATATYFWSLDIFVGLAAVLLGIIARHADYEVMYGKVSTGVILLAAVLYAVWRRKNYKE